jgi:hypothetical protein
MFIAPLLIILINSFDVDTHTEQYLNLYIAFTVLFGLSTLHILIITHITFALLTQLVDSSILIKILVNIVAILTFICTFTYINITTPYVYELVFIYSSCLVLASIIFKINQHEAKLS